MLIVSFSVAVEKDRAEEVRNTLIEDYGVSITREGSYTENLCWDKPETRCYMECFAPYGRFSYVTDYLDNKFDGTAILTY